MADRVEIRVEAIDAASVTFDAVSGKIRDQTAAVRELEAKAKAAGLALSNIRVDEKTGKVSFRAGKDTSGEIAAAQAAREAEIQAAKLARESEIEALRAAKQLEQNLIRETKQKERQAIREAREAAKAARDQARQENKQAEAEADRLAKRGDFLRMTFANLSATLLANTLGMAADAAGKLIGSLSSAGKFQTASIAAAQDIASNLNTPLSVARDIVDKSQIEIAKLAASLPGETEDYSSVFNSLSGSLAANFRGNAEGFQKASIDMTKRVTALASIKQANIQDAGSTAMRFLSGTSAWGEMRKNDLFQKNPELQKALANVASQEGTTLDKWQELSNQQRYRIFSKALELAAPEQLFDAFQGTYESVTQSIKTALIDPQMGVFGVLRKVDLSSGINTTVLDQAAAALSALFDMFQSIGKVFNKLGFDFDPMESLASTLNTFTGFVRGLDAALNSFLGGGDFDLGNAFGFDMNMIPQKFNEFLGGILKSVESFDPNQLGSLLGKGIAGFINGWSKFMTQTDFIKWGQIIGNIFMKVVLVASSAILNAVMNIDWMQLITAILNIPLNLLKLAVGGMFGMLTAQVQWVADGIKGFFQMISDLFEKAKSMIPNLSGNSVASAAVSVVNPIAGGVLGALNPMAILDKLTGKTPENEVTPTGIVKKAALPSDKGLSSNLVATLPDIPQTNVPSTSGGGTFAPSISVQAGNISDPDALAEITLQKLASAYDNWERQKLG